MSERSGSTERERRNTDSLLPDDLRGEASDARRLPRRPRGQYVRELFRGKRKSALKRATLKVCSRRCVYCGAMIDQNAATLDHVRPIARGGGHDASNLVVACRTCNQLKGDMLPMEFFLAHPSAGLNFLRYARAAHRALKRCAQRAVSLAYAA